MKNELDNLTKDAITHTQLVKYAGASGDFNPIHTVVPVAKEAGLGDVIAHGMLVMGFGAQALTHWFPRKNIKKYRARFVKPTRPGEHLLVMGKIQSEFYPNDTLHVVGEITIINSETNEEKLTAYFEVGK